MGIDAQLEMASPESLHPVDSARPQEPGLGIRVVRMVSTKEHKAAILAALTPSHVAVQILPPRVPPSEKDYISGEDLIIDKAEAVFRSVEADGVEQQPGELWVVNDINSAIGTAGGPFEKTMRKFTDIDKNLPHGVQLNLLVERITKAFSQFSTDTFHTVRIEALSAWRLPARLGLIVINERGYIQLSPWLMERLQNAEFVRNYLNYCDDLRETARTKGINPGVQNIDVPWGIRWDDLLSFSGYQEAAADEPGLARGIHLNIRTMPGQSELSALQQLIRGFSERKVNDAMQIVRDFLEHPKRAKHLAKGVFTRKFEPT